MKRTAIILLLVLTATAFAAEATIEVFSARSDGRNITVEWRTSKEVDVVRYEVERASSTQGDFRKIGTVNVAGAFSTYRFVDENAFLRSGTSTDNTLSGSVYVYRLRIVGSDDKATYTNAISVTHAVSSVRRTWGMIKEMFR
jgi:hypothetical protein